MYLLRIVCALVVASISTGVLAGKSMCASFQTNSITVVFTGLSNGSYNATLTFTAVNTCSGKKSPVNFIKVVRQSTHKLDVPTCDVRFRGGEIIAEGCSYELSSKRVSVTRLIDNLQGETWLLVGELENGEQFNETVEIRPERGPTGEADASLIVALAASAGILVVILFLALVAVCYLEKRRSGGWPLTSLNFPISRRPAHRDPNATLPRQPVSPDVEHGDRRDGEKLPGEQSLCAFYSDNYEVVKDSW